MSHAATYGEPFVDGSDLNRYLWDLPSRADIVHTIGMYGNGGVIVMYNPKKQISVGWCVEVKKDRSGAVLHHLDIEY